MGGSRCFCLVLLWSSDAGIAGEGELARNTHAARTLQHTRGGPWLAAKDQRGDFGMAELERENRCVAPMDARCAARTRGQREPHI
jgi:hypothetical protein